MTKKRSEKKDVEAAAKQLQIRISDIRTLPKRVCKTGETMQITERQ